MKKPLSSQRQRREKKDRLTTHDKKRNDFEREVILRWKRKNKKYLQYLFTYKWIQYIYEWFIVYRIDAKIADDAVIFLPPSNQFWSYLHSCPQNIKRPAQLWISAQEGKISLPFWNLTMWNLIERQNVSLNQPARERFSTITIIDTIFLTQLTIRYLRSPIY